MKNYIKKQLNKQEQERLEKRRIWNREYKRKIRKEDPEKYLNYMREYRRKNEKRLKAYDKEHSRKYREKNKEKLRIANQKWRKAFGKEYREKNLEKIRAYDREWKRKERIRNPEKIHTQEKRKREKQSPQTKLGIQMRIRIYDALKCRGISKSIKTKELIGTTIPELKKYLEEQFQTGMTWKNYGRYGWHVDHRIPLVSFDLTKLEEQKKAFHYTNLQPLWAIENLRKGAKIS